MAEARYVFETPGARAAYLCGLRDAAGVLDWREDAQNCREAILTLKDGVNHDDLSVVHRPLGHEIVAVQLERVWPHKVPMRPPYGFALTWETRAGGKGRGVYVQYQDTVTCVSLCPANADLDAVWAKYIEQLNRVDYT